MIPEHFGYPGRNLGDSLDEDQYVLLTRLFRLAAEEHEFESGILTSPHMAREGFNPEDIARLEKDRTVDAIYTNGEFEVYLARSTWGWP